jgi:ubiquinone/menaquinone biosynthesis C-methylase UbiE
VSAQQPASISFDRASEYYDRTRALPNDAMAGVIDLLAREIGGENDCLEIGIGTGRIGLPLNAAGLSVMGMDLSATMLAKLVDKFPLVRGDATALPFADGAFGAGIACHVLHLIPEWRQATGELVRVIRPGERSSWIPEDGAAPARGKSY